METESLVINLPAGSSRARLTAAGLSSAGTHNQRALRNRPHIGEAHNFISKDGFAITAACRRYLAPLIQGEDYPPYRNGLPAYVSLRNQPVARRLNTDFVLK